MTSRSVPACRIVGVSMVRNESDLVESFVRHNLGVLDALLVVDHRSEDGTREMLAALAAEGLPLVIGTDDSAAQRQPEVIGRLARRAFADGATCVIPLDADEFLKVPSRERLLAALASVPAGLCAAMRWQTYVPSAAGLVVGEPLAVRRRAVEGHGLHKIILTRAFAERPEAAVGPGNHTVLMQGPAQDLAAEPVRLALLPQSVIALAHLPVRSPAQLVRKIELGWRAHLAARRSDATLAFHWRELYEEFARTGPPSTARLQDIAVNYGMPMHQWQPADAVALVSDPLPPVGLIRYGGLAR